MFLTIWSWSWAAVDFISRKPAYIVSRGHRKRWWLLLTVASWQLGTYAATADHAIGPVLRPQQGITIAPIAHEYVQPLLKTAWVMQTGQDSPFHVDINSNFVLVRGYVLSNLI